MADDILGHEHLDHGKHLHKGPNAHHTAHGAHGKGKPGHAGSHHDGAHQSGKHGKPGHEFHAAPHGSHDNRRSANLTNDHVGILKKKKVQNEAIGVPTSPVIISRSTKQITVVAIVIFFLSLLFYKIYPAVTIAFIVIAIDSGIEYIKLFTSAIPIDFEILSVGTAYLAAAHDVGPALTIAILGPPIVELVRGEIHEYVIVKISALLIVTLAAFLLGTSSWQLFIAVLFGLTAQYIGMLIMTGDPFFNAMRRLTNAGFNAYIIFILLPGILHG